MLAVTVTKHGYSFFCVRLIALGLFVFLVSSFELILASISVKVRIRVSIKGISTITTLNDKSVFPNGTAWYKCRRHFTKGKILSSPTVLHSRIKSKRKILPTDRS